MYDQTVGEKMMPWLRKSQRFYCVLWLGNCHREQWAEGEKHTGLKGWGIWGVFDVSLDS